MSLLGDYSSAEVYFDGVLSDMSKYMRNVDARYLKSQWQKARQAVQEELDAIKEIQTIKGSFSKPGTGIRQDDKPPRSAGAGAGGDRDIHFQVLTPEDRRANLAPAPEPAADPDVWGPAPAAPSRDKWNNNQRRAQPAEPSNRLPAWARNKPAAPSGPSGRSRPVASKVDCWKKDPAGGKGKGNKGEVKDSKDLFEGPDVALAAMLEKDVLDSNIGVHWEDIAGLQDAKRVLEEAVVWPLWSPEMFTGLVRPPKGVLLFGPPGTGKTLLAKAVATECKTTFFNVSAATLASKYRGESERMVRILFDLARHHAPSTIFIDEIDSLCSSRGAGSEHEASRRVKTEFLVQIDGCNSGGEDGQPAPYVMVLAATNYPWDLDEALRRRMEKRIIIDLPDLEQRRKLLEINLKNSKVNTDVELDELARQLAGYSGDDCSNLCRRAAMNVMRRMMVGKSKEEIMAMNKDKTMEPMAMADFLQALATINASVSKDDVRKHQEWFAEFGSM